MMSIPGKQCEPGSGDGKAINGRVRGMLLKEAQEGQARMLSIASFLLRGSSSTLVPKDWERHHSDFGRLVREYQDGCPAAKH